MDLAPKIRNRRDTVDLTLATRNMRHTMDLAPETQNRRHTLGLTPATRNRGHTMDCTLATSIRKERANCRTPTALIVDDAAPCVNPRWFRNYHLDPRMVSKHAQAFHCGLCASGLIGQKLRHRRRLHCSSFPRWTGTNRPVIAWIRRSGTEGVAGYRPQYAGSSIRHSSEGAVQYPGSQAR